MRPPRYILISLSFARKNFIAPKATWRKSESASEFSFPPKVGPPIGESTWTERTHSFPQGNNPPHVAAYRASGLNLAVAAIILWNTVYLGHAVGELRSRGEILPDELLAHVAPLGWEHIAFNGDYVWPAEPIATAFRPLRHPRAEFLDGP
jgi:Tn3 transposase DDE domain